MKELNLNISKKRMDIYLDFTKGSKFQCPVCKKLCSIHDTNERIWRHLDFFQHETYLHARVPRTKCNKHGVKLVELPWTKPNTGFTLFFEALVVAMCKEMSISSVANMVNIHEDSAWRILGHYVDKARVIHIENGKGKDVFNNFRATISGKVDHEQIQHISMDMYPAFKGGAREYFPKATIVFDKFHVIKMINDAVDRVRRAESKENQALKKTKFIWLKNPENLSEKKRVIIGSIKNLDMKTAKVYQFRLALQRLWTIKDISIAREYLDKWHYWGTHSNIPEIVSVTKTIKKHSLGILEANEEWSEQWGCRGVKQQDQNCF